MLQQNNRQGQVRWYILGTLVALELLMSFSFLGYIHVEPISITTAYIPVLLAGVLLGPWEAMALGGVFGLASMWKATAHYVVNTDQLFSPTTSGNPFGSFVLSVVSRMLFGLLVGLLLQCFRNARLAGGWVALVAFLGPFLHALLVYGAMALCFPEAGYGPAVAVEDLGTPNDVVTKLVTMAIVLVVWRLDRSRRWNQFLFQVEAARKFSAGERYHRLSMVLVLIVTTCSAVAVAIYFVQRMNKVLSQEGIQLSETHYEDLLHLQIQFLIGILSMMALVIVFLIFNRRYATYKNAEAKRDALTGVMTRRTFYHACVRALEKAGAQGTEGIYFLMVDLDQFKEINDRHGHPAGDRALRETARALRESFGRSGLVGRIGGDEFAVLLPTPRTREALEEELQAFQTRIRSVEWGETRLTCSIGGWRAVPGQRIESLYQQADQMLYQAKEAGRDRYVLGQEALTGDR